MIHALDALPPHQRQTVIAAVTETLAGEYSVEIGPDRSPREGQPEINPGLTDAVLSEARERLRISPGDRSTGANARVYQFLVGELRDAVLSGVDRTKVRLRLGDRGALTPDRYRIEFEVTFREHAEIHRLKNAQVEEAIRQADAYQHLNPEPGPDKPDVRTSLFFRTVRQAAPGNEFSVLVIATRAGDVLRVNDAWRLYHDDVQLPNRVRPVDALRALTNAFGVDFRISGREAPARLILNEVIPLRDPSGRAIPIDEFPKDFDLSIVKPTVPGFRLQSFTQFSYAPGFQAIHVSFAYVINLTPYKASVARHFR